MKWGFEIILVVFLLFVWVILRREGFDPKDPALMTAIQAVAPPGANLTTYVDALQDFDETVFKYSDLPITMNEIQYYIVQHKIQSTDAEPLKKLMAERYLGKKRDTMLPVDIPAGMTYPAEPISDIIKPQPYESNDKDPVLPNSKPMFQFSSMDRGLGNTNVAAYSWDIKNYTQDSVEGQMQGVGLVHVPRLGHMNEGFSVMAGSVTTTNDVYGPRIPKVKPSGTAGSSAEDSTRMYPALYGPGNPYGEAQAPIIIPTATGATGTSPEADKKAATEALAASMTGGCQLPPKGPTYSMTMPDMAKTEPVPFLGDFSKFFR